MTGMTIAFTAYINLTGLISGSADAAAIRTAKTLISTVLPVVGGIASDASSAVLAAAVSAPLINSLLRLIGEMI